MIKHRSILASILALIAVLLISFASPVEAKTIKKPPTYTTEQLEQLQTYSAKLNKMRDRLPELADLIQKQSWAFVSDFIHGPLGEIRFNMLRIVQNLSPGVQPEARKLAKTVFDDIVTIDRAVQEENYQLAIRNYAETVRDFEAFLQLIPSQG